MKRMKPIVLGVAVLLIAGCATTFKPWKLSEIEEGMERDQVLKILGTPDFMVTEDGAEHLYFTYTEDLAPASDVTLKTQEDIDRRVKAFDRSLKEYKYDVILVDGKVLNYKEVKSE